MDYVYRVDYSWQGEAGALELHIQTSTAHCLTVFFHMLSGFSQLGVQIAWR